MARTSSAKPDTNAKDLADRFADLGAPMERDAPLGPRTWYGVGGPADLLVRPESEAQLTAVVARCRETGTPMAVLGSGANLLVRGGGVRGVVLALDAPAFIDCTIDTQAHTITAGAGYDLFKLVTAAARAGLAGLEQVAGIPASVGGAIRMNAGGSFGDIGSAVGSVRVMSDAGEAYTRQREDLIFGYRSSNIDAPLILGATFALSPDEPDALMKRVKEIFFYKKTSQPMGASSAGCAFKNPRPEAFQEIGGEVLPAGALIDRAGLKGFAVGGAQVSQRHANFIVASKTQPATAEDIYAVIQHVETTVRETFGITLQREVVVWGEGESPKTKG